MPRKASILLVLGAALAMPSTAHAELRPEDRTYGMKGQLELGGSAGLTVAANLRDFTLSPTAGYFLREDLAISGILHLSHVRAGDDSATVVSLLGEPSYQMAFNNRTFGFLGLGAGISYVRGVGAGVAIAPRMGVRLLVGKAGVLVPSLSWHYTTNDVDVMSGAADAMVAVSSSLRMNVGYMLLW
jgi:hypothetical protein